MSEDNRHGESGDRRVGDAYRALSTEQPSAALDRKILDMAKAGKPSASLARLLAVKPLAWAATMVLTVALVVQLQQTETADTLLYEDDVVPMPMQTQSAVKSATRSERADAAQTEAAIQDAVYGQNRERTSFTGQEPAERQVGETVSGALQDADSNALAETPASFAPAAAARAKLQEAEQLVQQRELSVSNVEDIARPSLSVENRRALAAPEPRYCSDTETADASSWYRCILALEEDGKLEEAAAERTRLFSKHPDFEVR